MNVVCEREQDKIKKTAMPVGADGSAVCDPGELIKQACRERRARSEAGINTRSVVYDCAGLGE